ncbi:hypothetical protein SDC9_102161 [bioreactor metagenome]|uniref:Uncharacterized protein n=1 Tax=bioreactor metagenome TaxID=1076179 RepID=A0A645AR29_9ZZZZ
MSTDALDPGVVNADGHKVRLREVAVILRVLLGAHGDALSRLVVPPAGLLRDDAACLKHRRLPGDLKLNAAQRT